MCFSMVVVGDRLKGLFIGSPEETWSKAADLSAKHHIKYMNRPFSRVLGIAPSYYDDLWVAGKVMYKLEPVIADDGELVLFAPHVKEISFTHGELIHQVGYHVRDYFLKQMHKYSHIPRGILAHSTNVKGSGTFDDGIEKSRIHLKLATAIPEEICRRINLGYHDPATINFSEWRDLEHEGILFVDKAGGTLYRIKE